MTDIVFKEKFIGFVDILGFKNLVKAAEEGTGIRLVELLAIVKELGTPEDRLKFVNCGPTTCPASRYIQRDLDFKITQISDCVVVSSEVSPVAVINLVHHCWVAVITLLTKGIMCRGYITKGQVYHTDTQVIGTGYQEACRKELLVTAFKLEADKRGTPFVEVDSAICDYVRDHGDACVKEMFSRFVKSDGVVTALFPFKRLSHSFIIGTWWPGFKFDQEKERQSNDNMRSQIENIKERVMELVDRSNDNAVSKAKYYIAALEAQLEVCKRTDKMLAKMNASHKK